LKKFSKLNTKDFYRSLPTATYITGQQSKLIWSVATDTMSHTIVQMKDSTLNGLKGKKIALDIQNKLDKKALNKNVIAWIPSSVQSDSTIVFCAHYDHLGKMGHKTIFYGANDNASGSGFLIGLGKYFSENPSKYNIALIFFSGEEAGLLGSKYFTENPTFPLDKIKLVWNIDLMGDATDGITVVNGNEQKSFVESIQAINQSQKYLPKILSRDNAPNSDHYPFIQKGVPAIFTYANGGKGHYHDIYDEYKTLSFKNIFQVFKLITNWVQEEEKKSFF
jgi:aminopeptidase YwaD